MPLSELDCRHAKPRPKAYRMNDSEGLYLDVRPTGKRYWRQRYRTDGKEKILTLGSYPELSLVKAREKRDAAKQEIRGGIDPSSVKQQNKRLAKYKAAQTFALVAKEWHAEYKDRWSVRHAHNLISRLEQNVFPFIGSMPISQITPPMIFACVRKIEERKNCELANRVLQIIGQVFRYAVTTGRAEHDMTKDLKGALRRYGKNHFASIEIDELPELIKKLNKNEARLYRQTMIAMFLMLLTFVRTSELIEARWSEFDLEKAEWNVPAERMKMRHPHFVPLSKQAVSFLIELQTITGTARQGDSDRPDYIFPSITNKRRPMSNTTILMALRRFGYYRKMTGHGFRSLAMSAIKEKLGYRHEVVDRQLAHLPRNKVDQAYDRAKFLPERVTMMQDWADYIDQIS